nr:P protein isoform X1 [Helicoverpa armigera]XP_049707234.1 P protein isoform X1 [Helicoverpa armigera]XP_049707235.1 P protein isoform X1 [Helicoverpa armigera]XP_049707236.1 P protein isoform X1 [Helicoverpa armigera]XP_049707237.1 P protein isoform X1 [Helicoverpa armigera]XP_049707238.1 P protein isoform X1 [Helicoverpa armigera]
MDKLVKSVKSWRAPRPSEDLSRSQYSLVSTDLTDGAVQLWLGLPDEVKYDPALEQFRQHYEKEHGGLGVSRKTKNGSSKRLPCVSSAPHLNNNVHSTKEEIAFLNGKSLPPTEEKKEKKEKTIEEIPTPKKKTKMAQAGHLLKMTILVACWMFFTVVFLMYNEKEQLSRHSSVAPGEVKSYTLQTDKDQLSVLLKLTGPFVSEQNEKKLNSSDKLNMPRMDVWLEGDGYEAFKEDTNQSSHWLLYLDPHDQIDFTLGETRSQVLKLDPTTTRRSPSVNRTVYAVKISTTANTTTPFALSYSLDPIELSTGVIYACMLLCALYILIIFEIINRTMAAVLVSTTSLAALALAGERPSLPELISWLDVETLLLLFSMMLLVAIMAETGLFDFLAVFTFEVTKGKIWPLITLLSAITAIISTFLDNVTTVLLMTPVTIRLCEVMDLDPIPVLMSMVLFSNIGGTVTPVGDPPNVIIASNKAVVQSGINFTNFTLHMTFGILLVCIQTYFQFRFIYRDTDKLRLNEPRDIQDLRHQISIWRRAADSLPHLSRDELVVRERLDRKVKKLTVKLEALVKETKIRACPKDCFETMLADMKDKYKIRDKVLLIKCTVAIAFVVTVFFLHSIPEFNRVSLGWTALLGALLLLTLADREDLEPILHRIEWSTLLFFAALFVLMEALSKLGLIEYIGGLTESVILKVDESARLAVAILLMLWVSGVTSAFVDNIPLTTMMVRVVTSLGNNPTLNLPMAPLIWALSFGACLGGNGTLIGASANVVCAGVAEQHGYRFTFVQFFKIGFPIMIGHLIVASGYLMVCHCLFEWH